MTATDLKKNSSKMQVRVPISDDIETNHRSAHCLRKMIIAAIDGTVLLSDDQKSNISLLLGEATTNALDYSTCGSCVTVCVVLSPCFFQARLADSAENGFLGGQVCPSNDELSEHGRGELIIKKMIEALRKSGLLIDCFYSLRKAKSNKFNHHRVVLNIRVQTNS